MRARGVARGARRLGLAIAVALLPHDARADAPGSTPTPDAALDVASAQYARGDFAAALATLLPACAGSERAECAFDLAAVYHALGRCPEAREQYLRYRSLAPDGPLSEDVRAALEEIEPQCGAPSDAPAPAPQPPRSSEAAGSPPNPAVAAGSPAMPATASRGAPATVVMTLPHARPASDPLQLVPREQTSAPPERGGSSNGYLLAALGVSGAAAVTSVVFGVLAASSASRCDGSTTYDRAYRDTCEHAFYRYRTLWQGFAAASVGALAIGGTIWWLDVGSGGSRSASASGPGRAIADGDLSIHCRYRF